MKTTTHTTFGKAGRKMTLALAAAATLCSCSMMHDDLDPCPQGADLHFVYDYNVQRADMFNDHVGGVTAYVFDEQGRFLFAQEEKNTSASQPLKLSSYAMHLQLQPGTYTVAALANQKGYDETLATTGAKYRRQLPATGETIDKLQTILDRTAQKVDNQQAPLDTLWTGLNTATITVRENEASEATISLMRDTKQLTISLYQLDDDKKADVDINDFDIRIEDNNGWLNHDGSLHEDEQLTYTPYSTWNTELKDTNNVVTERIAHAELMFNRLIYYPDAKDNDKGARLIITNKETNEIVADINLATTLAYRCGDFEHRNYSEQEFLDREYKYGLDFLLQGDKWTAIDLTISVLSWSKRIQRVDL